MAKLEQIVKQCKTSGRYKNKKGYDDQAVEIFKGLPLASLECFSQ